jgi:diaminohydroxyphosphoribosylaminopyrimidine deaminase / 5-amino-6-(5-phosphoribosylamino)uracil reductase
MKITENEAWGVILAFVKRSQRAVPCTAGKAWAVNQTSESLTVYSGGNPETAIELAAVDLQGTVTVDDSLTEPVAALFRLYLPLCLPQGPFTVGHLGQSLDGRIATESGASHYVTGPADILHNHRMRALFDAIIVGAGTAMHDDPQLTVRECEGSNPIRVVIDAERRLPVDLGLFRDDATPTLLLCASDRVNGSKYHGTAEIVPVARDSESLSPLAIRAALAKRGLHRLFIEGGGVTVSRFLKAGCLDRLQVTISPLIIGSGRPAIVLPTVTSLAEGLRPETRRFDLGEDVMFECRFHG